MPLRRAVPLVHPYPSALNAAVTAILVLLAGGTPDRAVLLGGAMLLLQFAIGAANDWADASTDAVSRPTKPIPSGIVSRGEARTVALASAAAGLALAAPAGPLVAAVALGGLLAGLAYNLALKGTPWAWVAFSAGFVLLPLFAWLGGIGSSPPFLALIVLLAAPAGLAVAVANGLVDLEGDEMVGRRGPAVVLGRRRSLGALLALHVLIVAGAAVSLLGAAPVPRAVWAGVGGGGALQGVGLLLTGGGARERRRLGWEVQAFGLAVLAASWFAGMAS